MTFPFPSVCPRKVVLVTSLSFVDQAINNTTTGPTIPGTAAAGDLGIFIDACTNASSTIPTNAVPSGWTQIGTEGSNNSDAIRVTLSYKILTAGDLGGTVQGITVNTSTPRKLIFIIRPNNPINTLSLNSSYQGQATSGNPTSQNVIIGSTPQILVGSSRGTSAVSVSGDLSTSGTALTTGATSFAAYYEIQSSATARTFDMGDSGDSNCLQTFSISVT